MSARDERSRILLWFKRGSFAVVAVLGLLAVAGIGGQKLAEQWDGAAYPAPGDLYDVGGAALHLSCQGQGPGTIILSSGMGNPASSWRPLEAHIAGFARVCSYDREGLGWSRGSHAERDATLDADQLDALLTAAEIDGPIYLVGHSYGALVARVFTGQYPARVSGLMLVDSSHEDMGERFPSFAQEGFRDLLAGFQLAPTLNLFGVPRLFGLFSPAIDGLEGEDFDRSLALLNSVSHMQGTAIEAASWEASADAARAVRRTGFGNLPLDVFVAGDWPKEMMPSWTAMQRELADLSSDSRLYVLEAANHPQIGMDARYVPILAEAIRKRIEGH